eukprot:3623841-Pyramimonas_sp.AAC.1
MAKKTNITHSMKVAQYNVKSLSQRAVYGCLGRKRRMRPEIVRLQLQDMGVLLAGLQETRNPKGIRPCKGFH